MQPSLTIERLQVLDDADLTALADVLIDCVEGGASVSFMLPLPRAKATGFWQEVAKSAAAGARELLVARNGDGMIVGTVQLVFAQPDNQPHRADISKLLVHRSARCLGLGATLMSAAEECARGAGITVLVLDTASEEAERLYERLGWQLSGRIPNYALWPDGGLCATSIYYKLL